MTAVYVVSNALMNVAFLERNWKVFTLTIAYFTLSALIIIITGLNSSNFNSSTCNSFQMVVYHRGILSLAIKFSTYNLPDL